jgi:hypothetical protein
MRGVSYMKKFSLLLSLLFLATAILSACGDAVSTSSDGSAAGSEAVSSDVSEDLSGSETPEQSEEPDKGVLTDVSVRENAYATVISNGASYVATPGVNETYPDPYGTKLTDGIRGAETDPSYTNEEFAGFVSGSGVSSAPISALWDAGP